MVDQANQPGGSQPDGDRLDGGQPDTVSIDQAPDPELPRLRDALARVGVPWSQVADCRRLAGGTYNTVFRVRRTEGTPLVVKLAPGPATPILRHENGILATEAQYYEAARAVPDVPVPEALLPTTTSHATRDDTPIPAPSSTAGSPGGFVDELVMTECPGESWRECREQIGEAERRVLREELGRHVAALHTITGKAFGYPAEPFGPLRTTWRAAFLEMIDQVLTDADRFAVQLPRPADEIRKLFAAQSPVLDEVTVPTLVHWDLWDGNILIERAGQSTDKSGDQGHGRVGGQVDGQGRDRADGQGHGREDGRGDGEPPVANSPKDLKDPKGPKDSRITALIDAERAFWGDSMAEFVSLALFGDIEDDDAFLAGYRSAGGQAIFDTAARRRMAMYRTYLYLIMWVEAIPRAYDTERVAWLRTTVLRPLTETLTEWATTPQP